jgi:DNA ligase-1
MANTLKDGETAYIQGSGKKPYELKNTGGVYSCSCPAWRNQGAAIDLRTCKHLRAHLGSAHEDARLGKAPAGPVVDSNVEVRKIVKGQTIAEAKGIDQQAILDRAKEQGRKLRPDEKAQLNGPPVLLAHKYDGDTDPTGWWLSEKLDGVRCYWDGTAFITRQGNVYHAPEWFTKGLPSHPVDGELWMGRGKFQQTLSVARRFDAGEAWRDMFYVAFDLPAHGGSFEERVAALREMHAAVGNPFLRVLEHSKVESKLHLLDELKKYVGLGAEGLMIREPGSDYEVGRSYTLLKVKQFQDDEATVIGYTPGKGRHKGVVGALEVRLKNGKEFKLGTGLNDAERRDPPAVGSTVTFSYTELSDDGVPKFAAFVCVRDYE